MAAQELGQYVSDFMKNLIMHYSCPRDGDLQYNLYEELCCHLQENLQLYVPADQAREISLVLIKHVNQTYNELMRDRDLRNACQKVAPLILKSVLHPSLNDLDAIPSISHPKPSDYHKVENCDLFYKTLPLLRGLKAVRLGDANRCDETMLIVDGFRETLETFSSRSCWDSDIETLAKNCKRLRCLDISGSEGITDGVVDYILQFEHLEELHLSEIDSLSQKALQRILNGFAAAELSDEDFSKESKSSSSIDAECQEGSGFPSEVTPCSKMRRSQLLKSFSCSNATGRHISSISQKFSNLTSLSLSSVHQCVLTPLRNLKHLRVFTLIDSVFFLVEGLLEAAGHQLTCLNFVDVNGTDFNFICDNCPSLVCLHLCFDSDQNLLLHCKYKEDETEYTYTPKIQSVKFLQLFLHEYHTVNYILKCFRNLRTLCMGHTRYGGDLLKKIIKREDLIYLEELFWGNQVVIKFCGNLVSATRFHEDGKTTHAVHDARI
jgi:hypothetical protein